MVLFIAVGALITGKIAANTREAKEKAQADQKLIDKYTAEAAELSAHIAEVKNEITVRMKSYGSLDSMLMH